MSHNSILTGAASELAVCADLLLRGFHVYKNVANTGVDLLAVRDTELYRIEVKTARVHKSGISYYAKPIRNNFDVVASFIPRNTEVRYEPDIIHHPKPN